METRYDSSARVQPTEGKYLAHPGTCAICGKVPDNMDEIFANPVIELEQYGYIYFCQACCAEIGAFVMMVPRREADILRAAGQTLERALNELRNENAYLRGLLDARISAARGSEFSDDGDVSIPIPDPIEATDQFDFDFDGIEPKSD